MYNTPYFIPNPYFNIPIHNNFNNQSIRRLGLFQRLGNSIKSINWTGMINNTSKTLGIINQSIPIVKQVGPVMNNMKSMLKIASIFKDETDIPQKKSTSTNIPNNYSHNNTFQNKKEDTYSPTFFIP